MLRIGKRLFLIAVQALFMSFIQSASAKSY